MRLVAVGLVAIWSACAPLPPERMARPPRRPATAGDAATVTAFTPALRDGRFVCLGADCEAGVSAAAIEVPGSVLVGVGLFRGGQLVDGELFEITAQRVTRIELDESQRGRVVRPRYTVAFAVAPATSTRRLPLPGGRGTISWVHGGPPAEITWRAGIAHFSGGVADAATAFEDLHLGNLGAVIARLTPTEPPLGIVEGAGGAVVAGVGDVIGRVATLLLPDFSLAIQIPGSRPQRLDAVAGRIVALPQRDTDPMAWRELLASRTARVGGALATIDAALAEASKALLPGGDVLALRTAIGALAPALRDAQDAIEDLRVALPPDEPARRVAAFAADRALAALAPRVDLAAAVFPFAAPTPASTAILADMIRIIDTAPAIAALDRLR